MKKRTIIGLLAVIGIVSMIRPATSILSVGHEMKRTHQKESADKKDTSDKSESGSNQLKLVDLQKNLSDSGLNEKKNDNIQEVKEEKQPESIQEVNTINKTFTSNEGNSGSADNIHLEKKPDGVEPLIPSPPPTPPSKLQTINETTNTLSLTWEGSTHPRGIAYYQLFRNGIKILETDQLLATDIGLASDTEYTYSVQSISMDGQGSDGSSDLRVRTKKEDVIPKTEGYREFKVGSQTKPELYLAQEVIVYRENYYKVLTTHSNYGDYNWAPDVAVSLFRLYTLP